MNKMDLINQFVSLDNIALAGISKTEQKFGNSVSFHFICHKYKKAFCDFRAIIGILHI
jgi:hypothetical protein